MKPHEWEIEIIDCGPGIGEEEFLRCKNCLANGGTDILRCQPFIVCGCGFRVSNDCEEADGQINDHVKTCKYGPCAKGQLSLFPKENPFWKQRRDLALLKMTQEAQELGLY